MNMYAKNDIETEEVSRVTNRTTNNVVNINSCSNKKHQQGSLLNENNDPEYSKCLNELKAFLGEYDDIVEDILDLKERLADLFKGLKDRGYDNKAIKAVLKERKMRINDDNYKEFCQMRDFYDEVFSNIKEW